MQTPKISVVVPVYNVELYVRDTLESLRRQTTEDFEVIVVDDGSTDGTLKIVREFSELRVRLIQHETNKGLAEARNTGVRSARGDYVALLDGDDMALPNRLTLQAKALDENPALGLVGSQIRVVDHAGRAMNRHWPRPVSPESASIGLCFRNTFSACFMFRKTAAPKELFGNYAMAEDYFFVSRLARNWMVCNLPQKLTSVRVRTGGLTHSKREAMEAHVRLVMHEHLQRLGIDASAKELDINRHVGALTLENAPELLDDVEQWLLKLAQANEAAAFYPRRAFAAALGQEWFEVCKFASPLGISVYQRYQSSRLRRWTALTRQAKLLAKCTLRHKRRGGDYPF